ncbi:DUF2635 domain-containing protein [Castellaniella caeni]|uniref:DUF2635 domain-containing protein n=1 Tax=Castellaniella caeni TaxID=266123 RepID=UPI000C9F98DF|nr:DUF2635 domain-containing protein [Castellaniella caeni]
MTAPRDTIKVRAADPALRVPSEQHPRKYITGQAAATVPSTAYYLRRLAAGELVEVPVGATAAGARDTKTKGA